MVYVRKSVWANGGDLTDPALFWYARGVGVMVQRPVADPTSWLFLAAMHGIDVFGWRQLGVLSYDDASLPSGQVQNAYWNQCQHQSWYFLPWHRGYLASLEAIIRAAVIQAGGPADWALPYWNYSDASNPNARSLPPAFTTQTMPDGSPNPLFVRLRFGASVNPPSLPLPAQDVALTALTSTQYTGIPGGDPGFGGLETAFSHNGGDNGSLESLPHNIIHVDVGAWFDDSPGHFILGLMSDPNTAALDPIFYLHHCNIDRLWEVWRCRGAGNLNPASLLWLDGPADRAFIVPLPNGQGWTFTARDVVQTTAPGLDYIYDDISDPLPEISALEARRQRLGVPPEPDLSFDIDMENRSNAELIGANNARITLIGKSATTQVRLDREMMGRVAGGFVDFSANPGEVPEPDRVFLNLENIRSNIDGPVIDVYVNLPADADPQKHPENFAGSVALFGVRNASLPDRPHGGMGVTQVLDITHVVDALHLAGNLDISSLEVRLVPRAALSEAHNVTVERVSVYRQGA